MMKSILRPSSYTNWSYTNTNYSLKQQQQQHEEQEEEEQDHDDDIDDKTGGDDEIEEDNNNNNNNEEDDDDEERSKIVRFTSPLIVEGKTKTKSTTIIIDGIAYDPSTTDSTSTSKNNIGLYERKLTRAEKKQLAAKKRAAEKAAKEQQQQQQQPT